MADWLFKLPQNYETFTWYETDAKLATSAIDTSMAFTNPRPWKLEELKFKLSTACGSVVDFIVWVSSILNSNASEFNCHLFSQAMNGLHTVVWHPDEPILMESGDGLNFYCEHSTVNVWGISVSGWAVQSPSE